MHHLEYYLTEQQKAEVRENLVVTKFQGDINDWLFQALKMNILNVQSSLLAGKWTSNITNQTIPTTRADIMAYDIPHLRKDQTINPGDRQKGILLVGNETKAGVEDIFRLECHISEKMGKPKPSTFEEWFQEFVLAQVNAIILGNLARKLESEHEDLLHKEQPQTA